MSSKEIRDSGLGCSSLESNPLSSNDNFEFKVTNFSKSKSEFSENGQERVRIVKRRQPI